jgi:membrane-associated phospholipid phosphatase
MQDFHQHHLSVARISAGWLGHFACLLCAGFYQMDMQVFIDNIFNTPLMWLVHSLSSSFSVHFFSIANHMGSGNIAAIVMLIFVLIAYSARDKTLIRKIVCYSAGSALMAGAAKVIVSATRPNLWPNIEQANGSSFPSSHAMASLSLAFIASWVLHDDKYRLIRTIFFATAISAGIARVYFGVHRPSDILLSWLIVISWNYWMTSCFHSRHAEASGFTPPVKSAC